MEDYNNLKEEGNKLYKKCIDEYPRSLWNPTLVLAI